jgi:hypothetical protein
VPFLRIKGEHHRLLGMAALQGTAELRAQQQTSTNGLDARGGGGGGDSGSEYVEAKPKQKHVERIACQQQVSKSP